MKKRVLSGILAAFMGIWGILAGMAVLGLHLASLRCLGTAFLRPFPVGQGLFRRRLKNRKYRDLTMKPEDKKNQK